MINVLILLKKFLTSLIKKFKLNFLLKNKKIIIVTGIYPNLQMKKLVIRKASVFMLTLVSPHNRCWTRALL